MQTRRRAASPRPSPVKAAEKKTTGSVSKKEPVVWGDYVAHDHLSTKNVVNGVLCLFALAPSFAAVAYLYQTCDARRPVGDACAVAIERPFVFANLLFFANVTVGFWVVGLLQRSFWLIDPYWTLIPPLLAHLYQLHPRASYDPARSCACLVLVWVWSLRLTHSYFRREERLAPPALSAPPP